MLDQFYSYLSSRLVEFFSINPLNAGAKYNIQFEKQEQVQALYIVLRNNVDVKDYEYKDQNGIVKYKSYQLQSNGVSLIVAATIDNVQPDFLTRLRNIVGVEPGYEESAILFIHDTNLDSIMGGTESLAKEGMPYNINSIKKDIIKRLAVSSFSEVDRKIIKNALDWKVNELYGNSVSIFEYQEIIEIINSTHIEKTRYSNFGLFYDSELQKLSGKEIDKRLEKNSTLYLKVEEIHNYGNVDLQLEKYFDEKGVDLLKRETWNKEDFKDVLDSSQKRIEAIPLEYKSCNQTWDRPEGTTKVKARIRNIIVFNPQHQDSVDLEFEFSGYLQQASLKTEGNLTAKTSGKRIKAIISSADGGCEFFKITYKDETNAKFEFRILLVSSKEMCLESIKTRYSIIVRGKTKYVLVNTNENQLSFNLDCESKKESIVTSKEECFELYDNEGLTIKVDGNYEFENDSELALFSVKNNGCVIPFGILGTSDKIAPIEGFKLWKLKREKHVDFVQVGENKLQQGTSEYFARDEFRKSLLLERQIIESGGMYFVETSDGIESKELSISSSVGSAYKRIITHFQQNQQIPSLAWMSDELKSIYREFIDRFTEEVDKINEETYLNEQQKNLFRLGVLKRRIEDQEMILTPLHPLNIAYQLHINDEIGGELVGEEIIKKLSSTYVLPYIKNGDHELYIPMEQHHSPEWKFYVDERLPRYKSSRDFVAKLVQEKIEEFISHFKYMFAMASNAPIKINLINTGDSKEILQGVFKYYARQLKVHQVPDIVPMDIYIYADKNITNAFEEVAFSDDLESLKEVYELDFNVEGLSEEDVLDLYRNKVHFYSKDMDADVEYAHITFIEMSNDATTINSIMDDITTGTLLNGSISGLPSVFLGDQYRTGFGVKFANTDNLFINVAIKMNALNTAMGGDPYKKNRCKAISIPNVIKDSLESVYNKSNWVTFIDPKVDLNFFKNDPNAKDLLIIHYSDQYTTAGGYDAITVTRKSGPYQRAIEEFLNKKGIEDAHKCSNNIINMFNAINGDWLLRLISSKSYFPIEKISILSAVKVALATFSTSNIFWVPISLEEVLRVSGGAGLKQSEGILSIKNLKPEKTGVTSDDILMIGIEERENRLFVHYYPIEVKIGENSGTYITKGIEQAKATKKIFSNTLLPNSNGIISYSQKVSRNFLMQLVVASAEKLKLYKVFDEIDWNRVVDSDWRRRLLNEEYEIVDSLTESIGVAGLISFKNGASVISTRRENEVMILEFPESTGVDFLAKELVYVREQAMKLGITLNSGFVEELIPDEQVEIELEHIGNPFVKLGDLEEKYEEKEDEIINTKIDEKKQEYGKDEENQDTVGMEIVFGTNQKNNRDLIWYPNDSDKLLHTNTGIIGTMGTGKTQFTKAMVTQLYKQSQRNVDGCKIGILIFDYKGDYNQSKQDFIEATEANVYELYHLPFNPLSITKTPNSKPMLPLHIANGVKETIAKAFGLGPKQETLFRDKIMEAYEQFGIKKNDKDTWNGPVPTLNDVYKIYMDDESVKKDDSLYAAFSNLIDFEIFEPNAKETKNLYELIDGVTVIDLSGYDTGIQNLVVAITLDLFYSQMQAYGHSKFNKNMRQIRKMVLVDEADNFLSKNFESIKKILKEGREFGVGTILSTQLLSHFSTSENDYANYIMTWIIHRVDDLSNKDVKFLFNTQSKAEEELLSSKIKSLAKHNSIVKTGDSGKPINMQDLAFWQLLEKK